ncbi:hypothetical protein MRQ36_01690 [Micromonospora sp. R77]|uniref:hypothetical protein n=1 Tax=Micromonospora sp. R77 TaxID=2925836 RepID=UPI001F61E32C|nr:hypothetical protein [Micromonospora sp. R77]MCI4061352.1 hypothetical protein [Micromonospora sp. R77]
MRVKLRPGTHFAPVPQGIYWTRAGRSFLLTAPAGLYLALDSQLDLLTRGTDVDELSSALGESARPAVQRILDTLLDRDVLLDLDRAGTPPTPGEADRYAEVLSYLEARCADPYRVFARLRASVVPVLGDGPAAAVARRTIVGYGATTTATVSPGTELVVLVDDADRPLDLVAAAASLPAGTRVVPVHAGERIALVGAPEAGDLAEFVALGRRAGDWAAAEPDGAAPCPLSAVLAGSLATHAVLGALTGTLPAESAPTLVHGHDVQAQRLPGRPPRPPGTHPRRCSTGSARSSPAGPGRTVGSGTSTWPSCRCRWPPRSWFPGRAGWPAGATTAPRPSCRFAWRPPARPSVRPVPASPRPGRPLGTGGRRRCGCSAPLCSTPPPVRRPAGTTRRPPPAPCGACSTSTTSGRCRPAATHCPTWTGSWSR